MKQIQGFMAQFMRTVKTANNLKYCKPQDPKSDAKNKRNQPIE